MKQWEVFVLKSDFMNLAWHRIFNPVYVFDTKPYHMTDKNVMLQIYFLFFILRRIQHIVSPRIFLRNWPWWRYFTCRYKVWSNMRAIAECSPVEGCLIPCISSVHISTSRQQELFKQLHKKQTISDQFEGITVETNTCFPVSAEYYSVASVKIYVAKDFSLQDCILLVQGAAQKKLTPKDISNLKAALLFSDHDSKTDIPPQLDCNPLLKLWSMEFSQICPLPPGRLPSKSIAEKKDPSKSDRLQHKIQKRNPIFISILNTNALLRSKAHIGAGLRMLRTTRVK